MANSPCRALANDPPKPAFTAIAGAMSDYVYRGVSLRNELPSPFLYVSAAYGRFYLNGFLVGTELGDDALGRGIGNIEADVTLGATYTVGRFDLDAGLRYAGYPNGRDLITGTLIEAERDFFELFAGGTWRVNDKASLGASVSWTPDFYYEAGEVLTIEGQAAYTLPTIAGVESKLTVIAGVAQSENQNAVSPGDGYAYWNIGVESSLERLVFDFRYWDTDVSGVNVFDQRFVVSVGFLIE